MTAPTRRYDAGPRTFVAKFDSNCASCLAMIRVGDEVFYASGAEVVSGLACCGDKTADELAAPAERDDLAVDEEPADVVIARTLPRGRTANDMCRKCFIIPASNGTCNCDA